MTNFEYWKDEIFKIIGNGTTVALVNDELKSCTEVKSCSEECEFNNESSCIIGLLKWLYAEHVEKLTLTEKERMFCELVETGYIARDSDEKLFYFKHMPVSYTGAIHGRYWSTVEQDMTVEIHVIDCLQEGFKFIKATDEQPWSVEELLKIDCEPLTVDEALKIRVKQSEEEKEI